MLQFVRGNLLESPAEAWVNAVNTEGVMGKGIALQFKKMFPRNFHLYKAACITGELVTGTVLVTEDAHPTVGRKIILNVPTKSTWRKPSEYSYVETGLAALAAVIRERGLQSVALPPLGTGLGGLDWERVRALIIQYLEPLACTVYVYEPARVLGGEMAGEGIYLTPARAMLLAMLYDLVHQGEFVSEFAAEKLAYFLQRFGGKDAMGLEFKPQYYGPYSGQVKRVLFYLKGSYLRGYMGPDQGPFDEIGIEAGGEAAVMEYLNLRGHEAYLETVQKTRKFLDGFYSNYALELLSSVDYVRVEKGMESAEHLREELARWSSRKGSVFQDMHHLELGLKHLQEFLPAG